MLVLTRQSMFLDKRLFWEQLDRLKDSSVVHLTCKRRRLGCLDSRISKAQFLLCPSELVSCLSPCKSPRQPLWYCWWPLYLHLLVPPISESIHYMTYRIVIGFTPKILCGSATSAMLWQKFTGSHPANSQYLARKLCLCMRRKTPPYCGAVLIQQEVSIILSMRVQKTVLGMKNFVEYIICHTSLNNVSVPYPWHLSAAQKRICH